LKWTRIKGLGNAKAFRAISDDGPLTVLLSIDDGDWHLSISHPSRYPTWNEIHDARYTFIPNKFTMAMILPPMEEYVNIHTNTFHLWQIKGEFE